MTEETKADSTDPHLDPISQKLQSLQLQAKERRGGGGVRWGRLFALLFLVVAGVGGYIGYEEYKKQLKVAVPEIEAITFGVRPGGGILLEYNGYIVPKTKVQVAPQSAGKIIELPIEVGMKVNKGDVICRIEDDTYRMEMERAQAAVALAEAQALKLKNGANPEEIEQAEALLASSVATLNEAKDSFDRAKKLYDTQGISDAELQKTQALYLTAEATKIGNEAALKLLKRPPRAEDVAVAEAQVAQAKATLQNAKIAVGNATIIAPCNGTILEKNAQEGELILPQTVITSLCVLADMQELEAEVDVQEREVARVTVGHPCQIIPDAYPDRIYQAELARITPAVNRQRGVVPVNVRILEPDQYLLADMNCRVQFLKKEDQDQDQTPTVPSRAIVANENVTQVFVLAENKATARLVKIGKTLGDEVEILEGLTKGEIVLLPSEEHPLTDGQEVRAQLLEETAETSSSPS